MSKVAVVGGGAGGAAAVAELVAAGHEVRFWSRSAETLAPFQAQGGVAYEGVLGEGLARPKLMTSDFAAAIEARRRHPGLPADLRPSAALRLRLRARARACRSCSIPGHTGGALEFHHAFHSARRSAAADRRILDAHLRGAQVRARSRHDHRQRQIRPACGLARRQGRGRRRGAGVVSQRKDRAGRARLRSCQCEHGAACARRGARRRLGGGDAAAISPSTFKA